MTRALATQHDDLGDDCHCETSTHEHLIATPAPHQESPDMLRALVQSHLNVDDLDERVARINALRELIAGYSPFQSEPVDFVRWVRNDTVHANDYNPNKVAPPEMELLRLSITRDGYTQPIVAMHDEDGDVEVIDGFHRHRVGKEFPDIQARVHGYLPIVQIRDDRNDKGDRIASTIRHNRARGKHMVQAMSDIVVELKRRNWTDERIGKELGMDPDEVLRLCQITGLSELFQDEAFSAAWDIEAEVRDDAALADTYAALNEED